MTTPTASPVAAQPRQQIYLIGPDPHDPANTPLFNQAEDQLLHAGHDVINPAGIVLAANATPTDYAKAQARMVTIAHAAAFVDGWEQDPTASILTALALCLRVPVHGLDHYLP